MKNSMTSQLSRWNTWRIIGQLPFCMCMLCISVWKAQTNRNKTRKVFTICFFRCFSLLARSLFRKAVTFSIVHCNTIQWYTLANKHFDRYISKRSKHARLFCIWPTKMQIANRMCIGRAQFHSYTLTRIHKTTKNNNNEKLYCAWINTNRLWTCTAHIHGEQQRIEEEKELTTINAIDSRSCSTTLSNFVSLHKIIIIIIMQKQRLSGSK